MTKKDQKKAIKEIRDKCREIMAIMENYPELCVIDSGILSVSISPADKYISFFMKDYNSINLVEYTEFDKKEVRI